MAGMSFFDELRRRNVVRVVIAYAAIGWVLAQLAEFAFENFDAPEWALKTFVVALLLGLPLVFIFAWAFELTPDGLKREKNVDRSQSITAQTGRRLDFIIIGVLILAIGFLLVDKFVLTAGPTKSSPHVLDDRQSIAVLPFANMSDDNDNFADGLSEELMNVLANNPDLKVAGRTSSFSFKGRGENFRAIGEALSVGHVLEGSVRRSGDTLRVTAQLIKVDDGFHLWSETYDRPMTDIFKIQDEVASAIARQLNLRLVPPAGRPTENVEAYAIYLEALAELNFRSADASEIAAKLDRAIAIDPKFAKAHELKAVAYWTDEWTSRDLVRQHIFESATTALALDPSLVLARVYVATSEPENWSWIREFEAIEQALRSEPDDVNLLATWCYDFRMTGYYSQLRRCAERLIEVEPLSILGYLRLAEAMRGLGFREEARRNWRRAIDVSGLKYREELHFDNMTAGEYDEAVAVFEEYLAKDTPGHSELRTLVKNATHPETGKAFLDRWITEQETNADNITLKAGINIYYLAFGYPDDFWRAAEKYGSSDGSNWSNAGPLFDFGSMFPDTGFFNHPAYLEHAAKSTLIDLWEKRGAPDRCNKDSGEWACR